MQKLRIKTKKRKKKGRKLLKLIVIIAIVLLTGFLNIQFFANTSFKQREFPITKEEILSEKGFIFDSQISVSKTGKYFAYVTMRDESMIDSKLIVTDKYDNNEVIIAEAPDFRFLTTPIWNPDNDKLAFARAYPFEVFIANPDGSEKEIIYSESKEEEKQKGSNLFNPSMTYGGKISMWWGNMNEIHFENTRSIPTKEYALNYKTKEVRLIGESSLYDYPTKIQTNSINTYDSIMFSQRDPKWQDTKLGTCDTDTIGSAGCAVTAVSMLLANMDYSENPQSLNEWLNDGVDKGYIDGCYIRWNMIVNYSKNIRLKGVYFNDSSLDRLEHELGSGNPVIVGWNNVAFTNIPHWALVVAKIDGEFYAADPWTGELKSLSYFGNNFDHMVVYQKI